MLSALQRSETFLFRKTELNRISLRQDKHISFCKARQEHSRRGICTAILRCILLAKLLSKVEDARVDRFGDRGNTKAQEADPVSAEYVQKKLEDSLKSSFRAIKFLWLPKKVTDKLQSCFYQLYPPALPSPTSLFLGSSLRAQGRQLTQWRTIHIATIEASWPSCFASEEIKLKTPKPAPPIHHPFSPILVPCAAVLMLRSTTQQNILPVKNDQTAIWFMKMCLVLKYLKQSSFNIQKSKLPKANCIKLWLNNKSVNKKYL